MAHNKENIKIKKFPIDQMKIDSVIFIIGKRGSGKSVLLKDILYRLRNRVDVVYGMAPTLDTTDMFSECMPQTHIYNKYDANFVKQFYDSLGVLKRMKKPRHGLLVLDDCMYEKGIMKSQIMREVLYNARHHLMTLANCAQYMMDMGPDARTNIDYLFFSKVPAMNEKQKLWKYFFGMFPDFDTFNAVLDKCTENYKFLVLNNRAPTNKIEDCVFFYKADDTINNMKFQMGRPVYWKLDQRCRFNQDQLALAESNLNLNRMLPSKNTTLSKGSYTCIVDQDDDDDGDGDGDGVDDECSKQAP
jgi:hypothetical protein